MAGKWLITTVEHAVHEHDAAMATRWYVAKFEAVPGDAAFRPARPRPAKLGGVQTMDVTGPGGSEIHTEALGQIKAHLRWDRRKQKDDTSSAWFRVTQPPTSGGFFLPINKGGRICGARISDHAVYAVLRKRLAEAGVARLSPHDLRRTFVGDLLDAGVDLATVQRLARHASTTFG